jgi:hypothetical protein
LQIFGLLDDSCHVDSAKSWRPENRLYSGGLQVNLLEVVTARFSLMIRNQSLVLQLAVVLLLSSASAPVAHQKRGEDVFAYARAFIDALARAEGVRLRIDQATEKDMLTGLTALRINVNRLREAADELRPFAKSATTDMSKTARVGAEVYDTLAKLFEGSADLFEKTTTAKSQGEIDALIGPMSRNAAEIDTTWRLLPDVTVLFTYTLVDESREEDGKRPYLKISAVQRQELLGYIDQLFPKLPAEGGGPAPQVAVRVLRQFLRGTWK